MKNNKEAEEILAKVGTFTGWDEHGKATYFTYIEAMEQYHKAKIKVVIKDFLKYEYLDCYDDKFLDDKIDDYLKQIKK